MSRERAAAYALDCDDPPCLPTGPPAATPAALSRRPAPATPGGLTPREREVATLIARGESNRQIATALVVAPRTAARHVENILNKLGLRNRAQVTAWAVQHGLLAGESG
jgi:DNA-binding NarL/FixJ family response regulator